MKTIYSVSKIELSAVVSDRYFSRKIVFAFISAIVGVAGVGVIVRKGLVQSRNEVDEQNHRNIDQQ